MIDNDILTDFCEELKMVIDNLVSTKQFAKIKGMFDIFFRKTKRFASDDPKLKRELLNEFEGELRSLFEEKLKSPVKIKSWFKKVENKNRYLEIIDSKRLTFYKDCFIESWDLFTSSSPSDGKKREELPQIKSLKAVKKEVMIQDPKSKESISITRGFEVAGNKFKFFIRIGNNQDFAITSVHVRIFVPKTLKLENNLQEEIIIGDIGPNRYGTAIYYLYCIACTDTEINASIEFKDPKGNFQVMKMVPFNIQSCKYVQPVEITAEDFLDKFQQLNKQSLEVFIPDKISEEEIISSIRNRMTMSNVTPDSSDSLDMFGNTKDGLDIGLKSEMDKTNRLFKATVFGTNENVKMGVLSDIMETLNKICNKVDVMDEKLDDISVLMNDIKADTELIKYIREETRLIQGIKDDTELIAETVSQLEDVFDKIDNIEEVIKINLANDFQKIKFAWKDFKKGKISKKKLILNGLKVVGVRFLSSFVPFLKSR